MTTPSTWPSTWMRRLTDALVTAGLAAALIVNAQALALPAHLV